ncbi:MAG: flagellar hook-length control protein FliK [Clostridiales bacterium]|jgi:hypothetical protein|nr:flagellar hook-length control protein FliK [Clostridiales bacterium]
MNIIPIIGENREAGVKLQPEQDLSKTVSEAFFIIYETQNTIFENGLRLAEGTINELKEEADKHENPQQADISRYFPMNVILPGTFYERIDILSKMSLIEAGMQQISPDPVNPERTQTKDEPVISILEGNIKDIGPLKIQSTVQQAEVPVELQPEKQRAVARMPQFTQYADEPDKYKKDSAPLIVNGDVLCPLENANDLSAPEAVGAANDADKSPADDGTKKNIGDRRRASGLPQVDLGTEKVRAAIMLEEASYTRSKPVQATTENLFDTMVKEIELFKTDESNQMIIQLKPEFLGKVTISLSIEGQGLHVKIRTEDPGIKSLIGGQISQLAQSLADKGIRVSDIDVAYNGILNQNSEQPQERQEPRKQNETRYRRAAGGISTQALLFMPTDEMDVSVLDMMLSSVEFRA